MEQDVKKFTYIPVGAGPVKALTLDEAIGAATKQIQTGGAKKLLLCEIISVVERDTPPVVVTPFDPAA